MGWILKKHEKQKKTNIWPKKFHGRREYVMHTKQNRTIE